MYIPTISLYYNILLARTSDYSNLTPKHDSYRYVLCVCFPDILYWVSVTIKLQAKS